MDPHLGPELRRQLRDAWMMRNLAAFFAFTNLSTGIVALVAGSSGWAIICLLGTLGCGAGFVLYAARVEELSDREWDLRLGLNDTPDDDG